MNDLEKAILRYLMTRDDGWRWVLGTKTYDKKTTIEMFVKDEKFRKFVVEQAVLLAIDLFSRSSKGEGSGEGGEK